MADKKDKTKETKGGERKAAAKGPKDASKAAARPKAKETKKEAAPAAEGARTGQVKGVPPRLKERYQKTAVPALMKEFNYKNPMQAPKLVKVVLNVGMGEAITNAKALDAAVDELGPAWVRLRGLPVLPGVGYGATLRVAPTCRSACR